MPTHTAEARQVVVVTRLAHGKEVLGWVPGRKTFLSKGFAEEKY